MIRVKKLYYVYCDLYNQVSTMLFEGEIKEYQGYSFMKDIKKGSKVFINSLSTLIALYPGGKEYGKKEKGGRSETMQYTISGITFHSMNALAGGSFSDICDIFKADMPVVSMKEMVESYGDPHKVRGTMASLSKKAFYAPIRNALWDDVRENKRYFNSLKSYHIAYAGRKSGILTDVKETRYSGQAVSYDKKSAYIGYFISDDTFPIGRPLETKRLDVLKELIAQNQWYKIVCNGKIDYLKDFYDERVDMTALEYWDIKALNLLGLDSLIKRMLKETDFTIMYTLKTGYLNKHFRDRLNELYTIKNKMSKDDPERFFVKTQLDMIYGKGIQWHDFSSKNELLAHYRGRGENYLLPHMSNHVSAHMRYDMIKVMVDRGEKDAIYADTDGIKLVNRDDLSSYFDELNSKIIQKNRIAGYDCDMGVWDFEGSFDKLAIFARKIYCYEIDGKITLKTAGMDERAKKAVLDSINSMEEITSKGLPFFTKTIHYNPQTKQAQAVYTGTIITNDKKVCYRK